MPSRRTRAIVLAAIVAAYAAAAAWYLASRPRYLTVVICDVGQGDAIIIRTPEGADVLVDGGRTDGSVLACLGRHLPPWDRTIELVILSHGDADHVGGLPQVAARYRIGRAVSNGVPSASQVYAAWLAALQRQGVEQEVAAAGDRLDLGSVQAYVAWPGPAADRSNTNESSVVVRLAYGSSTALLTGDIAAETELAIVSSGADVSAQLLKVAHHGSRHSSDPAFLAAVGAEIAAISVGEGNGYGHPGQEALGRLSAAGAQVHRTDRSGDLVFSGDGSGWRLKQPLLAW